MRKILFVVLIFLIVLIFLLTILYIFYPLDYAKIDGAKYNNNKNVISSKVIENFEIRDIELYYYKKMSYFSFNICNNSSDAFYLDSLYIKFFNHNNEIFNTEIDINIDVVDCIVISVESDKNLLNVDEVRYDVQKN